MSDFVGTRYRWVRAKKPELLSDWIYNLPFKVELKGGMVKAGKYFYQTFVLPDSKTVKDIGNTTIE